MVHVLDNIIRYHGPAIGLSSVNTSSIKCPGQLNINIGDIVLVPGFYEQGMVTSVIHNYSIDNTITTDIEFDCIGLTNETMIAYIRNSQMQQNELTVTFPGEYLIHAGSSIFLSGSGHGILNDSTVMYDIYTPHASIPVGYYTITGSTTSREITPMRSVYSLEPVSFQSGATTTTLTLRPATSAQAELDQQGILEQVRLQSNPQTATGQALDEHARMFHLTRGHNPNTGFEETDAGLRDRLLHAMGMNISTLQYSLMKWN